MVYPWQQEQWLHLWRAQQDKRLAHAYLFTGISGTGKAYFAECVTRLLLCQNIQRTDATPNALPPTVSTQCTCHACRLITGRAHPNLLWIEPEKAGQAIKVDQIRDVSEFINQTSLQGNDRVVIINPANQMNTNACNALLKTLEEPAPGSVMMLISDQASHLPATILSRCQHLTFPRPSTVQAIDWLKTQLSDDNIDAELILNLVNGAPLAAIEFIKNDMLSIRQELLQTLYGLSKREADPIKSASKFQDIEAVSILDCMLGWITDLLKLQLGSETNGIINRDYAAQLNELHQRTPAIHFVRFMDYLLRLRGQINSGINFNKTLMIENLFMRWMECA